MTDPHLAFAKYEYLAIRDKILADNPDIDDQTLADTVEGLSELPDKLATILRAGLEDETMVTALEIRIEQMRERANRLAKRARRRRDVVCDVMQEADLDRLTMPDFTASIRKAPPHVVETDLTRIPRRFWVDRPHLNKVGLLQALKNGEQIEGAVLSNRGMTLSVRTR